MNTPMPATEESNTAAMAAAAPAQPMVRFASVTKRYGELTVLEGLDLDVQEGEKVAIIGPSGSGKSTLLRVLMTLEGIDDGLIEVDGEEVDLGQVGDVVLGLGAHAAAPSSLGRCSGRPATISGGSASITSIRYGSSPIASTDWIPWNPVRIASPGPTSNSRPSTVKR